MARIKIEAVFTVPEDDVPAEARRLVDHIAKFVPDSAAGGVKIGSYYEVATVSVETTDWVRVK